MIWGLTPGPRLFIDESEFLKGLIGSFYVSNLAAVLITLAFIALFVWMLRQCLRVSSRDPVIFFNGPSAGPITVIAIILIFMPAFKMLRGKRRVAPD